MVELRQIVNDLIEYQLEDYPREAIEAKQQELNTAYDAFTQKYGLINSRGNEKAFSEDSSYYLLCSLENIDEDGNLERYNIFSTRMLVRCDADGKLYLYDLVRTKKETSKPHEQ